MVDNPFAAALRKQAQQKPKSIREQAEELPPFFRQMEQPGFLKDVQQASERLGTGLIDIAADYAPETTADVFGALTGRNVTPEEMQNAMQKSVVQNREYFEGRPFLESLPGRVIGDPTSIPKMTPGFGGAVGGFTEPTIEGESRLANTAIGAALGKTLGVVAEGGGKFLSEQAAALLPKKGTMPMQTADTIRSAANAAYDQAEKLGGIIDGKTFDSFLDGVQSMKKSTSIGKAVRGENIGEQLADVLEEFRGKPITLKAAQEVDEALTDRASSLFMTDNAQFRQVKEVQNAFRNMIEKAGEGNVIGGKAGFDALKTGRKLWSQGAKMRDVEKILLRAENMDNPRTAIKTGMRQLLLNDKKIGAYSKAEREAIAKAAKTGTIEDVARTFGSRLVGIIGTATGGPASGAVAQAGATASRSIADEIKRRQVGRVSREISDEAIKAMGGRAPIRDIAPEALRAAGSDLSRVTAVQLGREGAIQTEPQKQPEVTDNPFIDALRNRQPVVIPQNIPDQSMLKEQQSRVGAGTTDPYYDRLAFVESSNNATAKSKTSSAYGKYQITGDTAASLIRKYGDKLGVDFKNWKKPENQEKLARALTQENRAGLAHHLRRQPTAGEMYIAHFAGLSGAKKLLSKKNLNSKAATVMGPKVAMANKPIFFDLDKNGNIKRSRSVREVRDILKAKMEG